MYAIISDGGRQYRVEEGQELDIDYRKTASKGDELAFDNVLAVCCSNDAAGVQFGSPKIAGAVVKATVLGIRQGEKLVIQKFRRRKNYRRRTGHRQLYTRVLINKIQLPES